jgi:glyoxylase-like metal-dependent hydrolase (beta-lactamase superfamily II)
MDLSRNPMPAACDATDGKASAQAPVRLVRAPNPSPMTATGTNTWIVGRGQVAVIDPGPDHAPHLDAILAALAPDETVTHIIVTHAHLDHSALAPALARRTGAPLLAFGTVTEGRSPQMQALASAGLSGGGEGLDAAFSPDIRLRDGDAVQGAGWRLDVLHTPGHLSGHLCLALGDTLFTGDHVMGWAPSLVSPPDGDMGAYMAALRRLADRPWGRMLPGHGEMIEDPAARLASLIAHRESREAAILGALGSGPADLTAIVTRVYADTPPALHPAAARNAFAHLADLAARGLVTFRRT